MTAQAIEARRAEKVQLGSVHESAVRRMRPAERVHKRQVLSRARQIRKEMGMAPSKALGA